MPFVMSAAFNTWSAALVAGATRLAVSIALIYEVLLPPRTAADPL